MTRSRSTARLFHLSLGGFILTALLTACSHDAAGPADFSLLGDGPDTYFLTQPVIPDAYMEALFQGPVVKDGAGCLRLQSDDDATVIWPFGFSLLPRAGKEWVVDVQGREVGAIGGVFRFGGGEVPFLHPGLGYSPDTAQAIQTRCPGRFWIVGEIS